jgi:hypothetical protein
MATGPIFPTSAFPVTSGKVFPGFHVAATGTSKHDEGLRVMPSLDGDAIWRLRFHLPTVLPSGTLKLRLIGLCSVNSLVAKVNPKWASVAMGEAPTDATLQAEGTTTVTWGVSDSNKYIETKITLDADTAVAGEVIAMDLTFETSSWTLSQISTWIPALIWE